MATKRTVSPGRSSVGALLPASNTLNASTVTLLAPGSLATGQIQIVKDEAGAVALVLVAYGVGIVEMMEKDEQLIDRINNLTLRQLLITIAPPGFYDGPEDPDNELQWLAREASSVLRAAYRQPECRSSRMGVGAFI